MPWHRWEDNIEMELKGIRFDGLDGIQLAQNRAEWQTLKTANESLGSIKGTGFLHCLSISF
jgi:hypothetical protein